MDGIIKLRKKISNESRREEGQKAQSHRYYSIPHKLKKPEDIYTGKYLLSPTREKPPAFITEALGTAIPPALRTQADRNTEKVKASEAEPKLSQTEGSVDVGA
jgi:NAD(P)H-quinone oxidoreductase subunit K